MTEPKLTLRWGIKEWAALLLASVGTVTAAYKMRDDVLDKFDALQNELVSIRVGLESFIASQEKLDQRQDSSIDDIRGKQQDVRERLSGLESNRSD